MFLFRLLLVLFIIHIFYIHLTNYFLMHFLSGMTSVVGLRGSGKTTLASAYSFYANKLGFKVYANFPLQGSYQIDVSDLGVWDVSDGVLIIDEAGIDLSNRKVLEKKMKGIQEENRRWWKLSRHYGISNILILSQSQDYDILLRRMSERCYIMESCSIFHNDWSKLIPIRQHIDKQAEDYDHLFYFSVASCFFIWFYRKPFYNTFNSWEAPELPKKDFDYHNLILPEYIYNKYIENYKDYTEYLLDNKIDTGYI